MISTNGRKLCAMALVLVALVTIFVPVASADVGSQTWYLYTRSSTPSLDKSAPGDGSEGSTINNWDNWVAEYVQCDLTMPAGTWTLDLDYSASVSGYIDVGVYDGTDEEIVSVANIPIDSTKTTIKQDMAGVSTEFTKDTDRISLWIRWVPSEGTGTLTINYGSGKSRLASPSGDPGYPVPEMNTLALFSIGLLALVGYVAYRRRDR